MSERRSREASESLAEVLRVLWLIASSHSAYAKDANHAYYEFCRFLRRTSPSGKKISRDDRGVAKPKAMSQSEGAIIAEQIGGWHDEP